MKRGEIWLVSLDRTAGHEQKGHRPLLVVSPNGFNRVTRVPVVLPVTSGGKFAGTAGFAVSLTGAGTSTTGVVRCDQPRSLDLNARGGSKLEVVPMSVMEEVLARLITIVSSPRPAPRSEFTERRLPASFSAASQIICQDPPGDRSARRIRRASSPHSFDRPTEPLLSDRDSPGY